MKWFRVWNEALDNPKVQRMPPHLFKIWVNLLCLASGSIPRWGIPPVAECAFRLRLNEDRMLAAIDELVVRGLLDRLPDGISVHGWERWQPGSDDVTARVTKHRRSRNVTETPPDTDTDTDTEQKQIQRKRQTAAAALADADFVADVRADNPMPDEQWDFECKKLLDYADNKPPKNARNFVRNWMRGVTPERETTTWYDPKKVEDFVEESIRINQASVR